MTREAFIRKWLSNKDFQYCEEGRAQMREDLDKVIDHAQQKLNMASVVRPAKDLSDRGELLGNEAKATVAARGLSSCMFYLHKTCICKDECWYTSNVRKSSEGQP